MRRTNYPSGRLSHLLLLYHDVYQKIRELSTPRDMKPIKEMSTLKYSLMLVMVTFVLVEASEWGVYTIGRLLLDHWLKEEMTDTMKGFADFNVLYVCLSWRLPVCYIVCRIF